MLSPARRDFFELAVAYGLIEATLWTAGGVQRGFFWAAAAWVVITTSVARRGRRELGLGLRGLQESLWVAGAALFLAAGAVLASGKGGTLHSLFGIRSPVGHALSYAIWAEAQQFLAQSYFFVRVEAILSVACARTGEPGEGPTPRGGAVRHGGWGAQTPHANSSASRRAVPLTTALFAAAHIPNLVLMVVTLGGGLVLSEVFRRHRNIYALGLAHGLVGLALAVSVPDQLLRHMRVGLGYLRY